MIHLIFAASGKEFYVCEVLLCCKTLYHPILDFCSSRKPQANLCACANYVVDLGFFVNILNQEAKVFNNKKHFFNFLKLREGTLKSTKEILKKKS